MPCEPASVLSSCHAKLGLTHVFVQSPAEMNLYTYVVNNPLNRTDPLGLQWECLPWDPWCWYPCPWWDPFCYERWPRRRPRGDDGEWCPGWPGRACGWGGGWGWGGWGIWKEEPPWVKDCAEQGKDRDGCLACCEENVYDETVKCLKWLWEPHLGLWCLVNVEIWEYRCEKNCDKKYPKPKPLKATNYLFRGN